MRNTSAFQPRGTTRAYYTLNGNSHDRSSQGNTGTDTAITYPQGRFGQAAKFNGSSSQILFTTVPQTGAGSFTASVWVKGSTLVNNMEILFWGNVATHQGFDVYMNTSGVMSANFYGGGGQANATTKLTTHSWQHVVATYDGNNTRIYINGRLEGVSSAYTSANIGTTNKFIGKDAGGGNWWNGLADEIILESRAWTAKEVETYYRKSMLNYKQKSFGQMVWTYISELGTGVYALSGKNITTLRNYVAKLLKGAYTLTGKQLTANKAYVAHLLKGVYNLVGKHLSTPNRWVEKQRNSSTWTEQTRNSSTWTEKDRN